mgnify:CR=1 FL=1
MATREGAPSATGEVQLTRKAHTIDDEDERASIPVTINLSKDLLLWIQNNTGRKRLYWNRTVAIETAVRELVARHEASVHMAGQRSSSGGDGAPAPKS